LTTVGRNIVAVPTFFGIEHVRRESRSPSPDRCGSTSVALLDHRQSIGERIDEEVLLGSDVLSE